MQRRRIPYDRRAPVVTEQDRLPFSEMINQPEHVAAQGLQVMGFTRMRGIAAAVAAHFRNDDAITRVAHRADLMPPRIPGLRPAMDHQNRRPVALDDTAQVYAVGADGLEGGGNRHGRNVISLARSRYRGKEKEERGNGSEPPENRQRR